jgi:hypothetical protein
MNANEKAFTPYLAKRVRPWRRLRSRPSTRSAASIVNEYRAILLQAHDQTQQRREPSALRSSESLGAPDVCCRV